MKVKYEVSVESGFDVADCHPTYKVIRTFKGRKNEQNAISFIEDQRNLMAHGYMFLEMYDEDGTHYTWNDDTKQWDGDGDVSAKSA